MCEHDDGTPRERQHRLFFSQIAITPFSAEYSISPPEKAPFRNAGHSSLELDKEHSAVPIEDLVLHIMAQSLTEIAFSWNRDPKYDCLGDVVLNVRCV